jgi:hypothetical protein
MSTTLDWEQELDDWTVKYKPIKNHLDDNASGDGDMFETFGPEVEFVRAQDPRCIWTLVDCGDALYIINGYHFVNRLNYFVTEVPFDGEFLEVPYYIFDDEDEEDE